MLVLVGACIAVTHRCKGAEFDRDESTQGWAGCGRRLWAERLTNADCFVRGRLQMDEVEAVDMVVFKLLSRVAYLITGRLRASTEVGREECLSFLPMPHMIVAHLEIVPIQQSRHQLHQDQ